MSSEKDAEITRNLDFIIQFIYLFLQKVGNL